MNGDDPRYEELRGHLSAMRESLDYLELEDALTVGHLPTIRQVSLELEELQGKVEGEALEADTR